MVTPRGTLESLVTTAGLSPFRAVLTAAVVTALSATALVVGSTGAQAVPSFSTSKATITTGESNGYLTAGRDATYKTTGNAALKGKTVKVQIKVSNLSYWTTQTSYKVPSTGKIAAKFKPSMYGAVQFRLMYPDGRVSVTTTKTVYVWRKFSPRMLNHMTASNSNVLTSEKNATSGNATFTTRASCIRVRTGVTNYMTVNYNGKNVRTTSARNGTSTEFAVSSGKTMKASFTSLSKASRATIAPTTLCSK